MSFTKTNLTNALKIQYPLIVAPMAAGPSSVELVAASSEKGALGFIAAAYSSPQGIEDFAQKVRMKTQKPFGINLFIPEKISPVTQDQIDRAVQVTANFRQELLLPRPDLKPPYEKNFDHQFESVLRVKPRVFSFVFGVLDPHYISNLRNEGIFVIGTATSLDEAMQLVETGVDAIVLQGIEGGGHRGIFNSSASDPEIKTLDLLNFVKAKTKTPLIAAGGMMSSLDIQKMLAGGAQAVQMGTALLCTKEAGTSAPYRRKLLDTKRVTKTTRAFSGRLARGIENRFMTYMDQNAESILPFPAQNKFTRDLRSTSAAKDSPDFLSLWSGMGAGDLWTGSAADLIEQLFKNE